MCNNILPLFPKHRIYVEPFCGAGTLLFAQKQEKNKIDVLNDINSLVFNFFNVLKTKYSDLIKRLEFCPYSEELYRESVKICKNNEGTDVEMAEAFFINIMQSFGHCLNGSWARSGVNKETRSRATTFNNRIERLRACSLRLKNAYISNEDAIKCIERWDSADTFFYCDPPYIDTDCGHYSGYTKDKYQLLIKTLENCKGKALVSGYENDIVPNTWKRHKFHARSSISNNTKNGKYDSRIEVVFEKPEKNNDKV